MKRKTWYHIAMFLPLVWPFLALALFGLGLEAAAAFGGILTFAALIGGIPYLFFVAGVFWWGRNKTADQMRTASWLMPLLFTPVFAAGFAIMMALDPNPLVAENAAAMSLAGSVMFSATFVLPIGYFYVICVHLLTALLKALRLVKD